MTTPRTRVALSQQILDDITGKIVSGAWPPGHRIPFEHDLANVYRCSRMTVNKALTQLARSGLVERRRRSGSFVARQRSEAAVLEIREIRAEVEALNLAYGYEAIARQIRRATPGDRAMLGAGGQVVAVTALHRAGGKPFCLEERLINLAAVPAAAEEDFRETSPGAWLLAKVPWSAAEHRIRAIAADRESAERLRLPQGFPCLVIERRTFGGDKPVTFVRLTYPGDSHSLVARFSPN